MQLFHVQLFADGAWSKGNYQQVQADTKKQAAEILYGKPLKETGPVSKLRAKVRGLRENDVVATLFYEL